MRQSDRILRAAFLPVLSLALCLCGAAPPEVTNLPACRSAALSLRVESGDGRFTGMAHDGAIVVLRNVSPSACALPVLPALSMRDARGVAFAIGVPRGARFLHPGPVAFPLNLRPGELAAARLRWIVGDVFAPAKAHRVVATSLDVTTGGGTLTSPIAATIWAASQPATFAQDRLTTALPPLGAVSPPRAGSYVGEGPAGATYVYAGNHPARRLDVNATHDGFSFAFQGTGGMALATGSIRGALVTSGDRATFDDSARDCHLQMRFFAAQLTVVQRGSCGFGNGVSASGQYRQL